VATVSAYGLVTARAAGTATITVTTQDGGITATCYITVKSETGAEVVEAPKIVYARGVLSVNTPQAERIEVYSISGQLLYNTRKKTSGTETFRIGHLPRGILIARGSSGWVKKIIQ
jgi:hypothetical protein